MKGKNLGIFRVFALTFAIILGCSGIARAQSSFDRKPLPPRKTAKVTAIGRAMSAAVPSEAQPSWEFLTNQPPVLDYNDCGRGNPILLTDGTVMLQDDGCQDWWKLTPDESGSYVNGTWTELASLPPAYSPLYHSSAVLPDGRVIIEGGEYNFLTPAWTNMGAIYDPLTDTWTTVNPPDGWDTIGDAQSVILFDGTFMQANCCNFQSALLDPATLSWTLTGSGKFDVNDEEGWTLLPDKQVLTVDAYVYPYDPAGTNSEIYNHASGKWHSAGSTVVQLWDSAATCGGAPKRSSEIGPGVLRPDGTVFYAGANSCGAGHTAIYKGGTWTPGPDFPDTLDIADGPAALEPNGKVLLMASPTIFNGPQPSSSGTERN
jgi:hypothetical protein